MRRTHLGPVPVLLAAALLLGTVGAACSSSTDDGAVPTTATTLAKGEPVFAGPGPYDVGFASLALPDRKVAVWYPAPKGSSRGRQPATYSQLDALPEGLAAAAPKLLPAGTDLTFTMPTSFAGLPASPDGPFPLVVFSHGFGSFRLDASSVVAGIASWGFVVAAPEHTERDRAALVGGKIAGGVADVTAKDVAVITDTIALVGGAPTAPLAGLSDTKRVGVVGHSAGGRAALSALSTDQVDVAVGWAPAGRWDRPAPDKPSMLIAARVDVLVPLEEVRATFAGLSPVKRLVVMDRTGHNTFTDICKAVQEGKDLIGLAEKAGLAIPPDLARGGRDGCTPGTLPTSTGWAVTQHFTVAELRNTLVPGDTGAGLGPKVATGFPGATIEYRTVGGGNNGN